MLAFMVISGLRFCVFRFMVQSLLGLCSKVRVFAVQCMVFVTFCCDTAEG